MAISILQSKFQSFVTAASPINAVYTSNTTPGSVLIAAWAIEIVATLTFSDGNGTYTVDQNLQYDAAGLGATTNLNIARISNTLSTTSGCSLSWTGGGTRSAMAMLFEVTGLAASPVDQVSSNDSNGTSECFVSITPANPNDLLIAMYQTYNANNMPTADSGFTLFNATNISTSNFSACGEYLVPAAATSYTPQFGSNTNQYFGAIAVAYKPSGGPPPSSPTPLGGPSRVQWHWR